MSIFSEKPNFYLPEGAATAAFQFFDDAQERGGFEKFLQKYFTELGDRQKYMLYYSQAIASNSDYPMIAQVGFGIMCKAIEDGLAVNGGRTTIFPRAFKSLFPEAKYVFYGSNVWNDDQQQVETLTNPRGHDNGLAFMLRLFQNCSEDLGSQTVIQLKAFGDMEGRRSLARGLYAGFAPFNYMFSYPIQNTMQKKVQFEGVDTRRYRLN